MAYYTSVISSGATAPSLASYVKSAVQAVEAWNVRRQTREQLKKLTIRELDDIGLTVADADTISRRF